MANNPQYIKDLARQSGKSDSAVSTAIDNAEKQLSNSPQKKAYDNAKDNDRDKKYQEYWGAVMLKVRTILGMPNPKTNIPESEEMIEEDGEIATSVNTTNMGSPTTADGQKSPHGSSAIYAKRMGMTSRGGDIKKKKKKIRESIEYIDTLIEF